jgi:hypothetical protein
MANVTITIPDQHLPNLSLAIARQLDVELPATNPLKIVMVQTWFKQQAKQALADYLAQEAAHTARAQTADWV